MTLPLRDVRITDKRLIIAELTREKIWRDFADEIEQGYHKQFVNAEGFLSSYECRGQKATINRLLEIANTNNLYKGAAEILREILSKYKSANNNTVKPSNNSFPSSRGDTQSLGTTMLQQTPIPVSNIPVSQLPQALRNIPTPSTQEIKRELPHSDKPIPTYLVYYPKIVQEFITAQLRREEIHNNWISFAERTYSVKGSKQFSDCDTWWNHWINNKHPTTTEFFTMCKELQFSSLITITNDAFDSYYAKQ
jgi:hypothetical protein